LQRCTRSNGDNWFSLCLRGSSFLFLLPDLSVCISRFTRDQLANPPLFRREFLSFSCLFIPYRDDERSKYMVRRDRTFPYLSSRRFLFCDNIVSALRLMIHVPILRLFRFGVTVFESDAGRSPHLFSPFAIVPFLLPKLNRHSPRPADLSSADVHIALFAFSIFVTLTLFSVSLPLKLQPIAYESSPWRKSAGSCIVPWPHLCLPT